MVNEIKLLNQETIDKIAAGEVVERPASVVKELVENAIDAGATAITVEIKDGGTSLIRITDNGSGIPSSQIPLAFLRHSTSKIRSAEDLSDVKSLGFRGEALSSIAAVSHVELITKTKEELLGTRYVIEGGREISMEEIGAPDGTTFFVQHIFYNTPARKKFLKSNQTEGGYIFEILQQLALSHPEVAVRFISQGQEKMSTTGNGNRKDTIYQIFGREIAANLLEVDAEEEGFSVRGYIGNSVISRGNRNFEHFYVQGRYVKSNLLSRSVEEGYQGFLMQHQYPFCALWLSFPPGVIDVNVHPTKQEVRIEQGQRVYEALSMIMKNRLSYREDIRESTLSTPDDKEKREELPKTISPKIHQEEKETTTPLKPQPIKGPEPFEAARLQAIKDKITKEIHKDTPYESQYREFYKKKEQEEPTQLSFLSEEAKKSHRIIGQVFDTYWLVEFDEKLYIIDQHAAHEKVLYEKTMKKLKDKEMTSQRISPPIVVTLSVQEEEILHQYQDTFTQLGFEFSEFGGREYAITGVPGNLFSLDPKSLFLDVLQSCCEMKAQASGELVMEKVASMSCKAAVKGNQKLSRPEVESLIDELLTLDNPYHCPHGRPTIITISKQEMEKKFKRIV